MFMENCESPPSESQKITLAKSFLRDEALRWWCAREKNVQRAVASGDPTLVELTPAITTWRAFQKAVTDYFCPRGASDEARNELHRLRQHQFRSLEAYSDHFETVSRRIEVPAGQSIEEELIATFKAGLMDGLIRLSLTNTKPRTLFQAIQQAHQAESDLRVSGARSFSGRFDTSRRAYAENGHSRRHDGNHFARFRSGGGAPLSHPSHSHSNRMSGAAVPMDLSAMMGAEKGGSGSDSDQNVGYGRRDQLSSGHDGSSSPPPGSATGSVEDRSPQSSPESGDADVCASCQLNAAPMRRTFASSRCPNCGQHTQQRPRKPSECWNCGQTGHLRRDCPKPQRDAGVKSGNSRDDANRSRHF